MKKKLRVAILFGGKSAEHEISVISARNIVQAMDKKKYDIVSIGIDKQGCWFFDEGARLLHLPKVGGWEKWTWSSRCSTAPLARTAPFRGF